MKKNRSHKMVEKIVETTTETASSYFGSYLIGLALLGGGALVGSIWYCLSGETGSENSDSLEKSRNDYCEKLKSLSDDFLITSHERISNKSLRIATNLCNEVREKFDLSHSDNYTLNMKLLKLEREIETIRAEKEYVKKNSNVDYTGMV